MKVEIRNWTGGLLCIMQAVVFLLVTSNANAYLFSVTDLGTLGGATSSASKINDNGQITGNALDGSGNTHAFIWESGVMTDLGTLGGGNYSSARGISSNGTVIGSYLNSGGRSFAYVWTSAGGMVSQGSLSTADSEGLAISDNGTYMTGWSFNAWSEAHGVIYDGVGGITNDMSLIPTAVDGEAWGVNDSGLAVGFNIGAWGRHVTTWTSAGGIVDRGTMGSGNQAFALGVNNAGYIVGRSNITSGGQQHAYIMDSATGIFTDLGLLGGSGLYTWGEDINDLNQVVGRARDTVGNDAAIFWDGTTLIDLNTQLDASGTGWVLQSANGINENGWIVGRGLIGGVQHAFLLTPAPEPSTYALLGLGMLAAGLAKARRSRAKQ